MSMQVGGDEAWESGEAELEDGGVAGLGHGEEVGGVSGERPGGVGVSGEAAGEASGVGGDNQRWLLDCSLGCIAAIVLLCSRCIAPDGGTCWNTTFTQCYTPTSPHLRQFVWPASGWPNAWLYCRALLAAWQPHACVAS